MTLTELSNLFNQVAQAIPEINNYHFGYLSDVNTPIINNSNPSVACQAKYPMLLLTPPDGSYSPSSGVVARTLEIWVFARQDSDDSGTICDTLVERFSFVEQIGNDFLRNLFYAKNKTGNPCLKISFKKDESAATTLDGYQLEDRLVAYKMTIGVQTPYKVTCLGGLEYENVNPTDDEKTTCPLGTDSLIVWEQESIHVSTVFTVFFCTTASMNNMIDIVTLDVYDQEGAPISSPTGDLELSFDRIESGKTWYKLTGVTFSATPSGRYWAYVKMYIGSISDETKQCSTLDLVSEPAPITP